MIPVSPGARNASISVLSGVCQNLDLHRGEDTGRSKSSVVYQDERRPHEDAVQVKTGIADSPSRDRAGQNEATREHATGHIR